MRVVCTFIQNKNQQTLALSAGELVGRVQRVNCHANVKMPIETEPIIRRRLAAE